MATDFGPTALATPANGITIARFLGTPALLILIAQFGTSWLAFVAWAALAGTDGLDGWLARRHGTTRSGAFLDPLADKFLILAAMAALVAIGRFWWVPVAIIAAREGAMSAYRSRIGSRGITLPARRSAKAKTLVQSVAVALALLPPAGRRHPMVATSVLWVAVGLTLVSGAQYLLDRRQVAP